MIRLDVFRKDGKNHFVPIYVSDTVKDKPPTKIKPESKKYSHIDDSYQFLFSLKYNDLIKIKDKKEEYMVYYIGYNISSGMLKYVYHDSASLKPLEKGGKSIKITKYQVDVLGNYEEAGNEIRMHFNC